MVIVAMMLALPTTIQSQPPRIVTPTVQVTLFSGLENELGKALKAKDTGAMNALLSDDFEEWSPKADPAVREDWVRDKTTNYKLTFLRIRDMAVHSYAEIAIASFIIDEKIEIGSKPQDAEYYVVDVWKKKGGTWQLATRYLSKIGSAFDLHPKPSGRQ